MKIFVLIFALILASSCAHQPYGDNYMNNYYPSAPTGVGFYGYGYFPYGRSTWNGTASRPGDNQQINYPVIPYRSFRAPASRR